MFVYAYTFRVVAECFVAGFKSSAGGDGEEAECALDGWWHGLDVLLGQAPVQPNYSYPGFTGGGDSVLNELVAGSVAGAFGAAKRGGEEEVLHVNDDEGGFAWGDGDRSVCGLHGEFGPRDGFGWQGGMGEVKACLGGVEPEV